MLKTLEMRYFGQNRRTRNPFYDQKFAYETIDFVWQSFHLAHKDRYNFDIANETIELISIKVTALALTPKPEIPRQKRSEELPSPYQKREVFLDNGKVEVAVYRRDELPIGKKFKVPALIEEDASVTVVESDMPVVLDDYGNILLGKLAAEF